MTNHRPQGHPQDRHDPSGLPRETLRVSGAGQLLTLLPYLLGFHPSLGSIVIIAFRGNRYAFLARLDLPTPEQFRDDDAARRLWDQLDRQLAAVDAETLVLVGYTDSFREGDLYDLCDTAPLPVRDLLRVMHTRWWSLNCPSPALCKQDACRPWGDRLHEDPELAAVLISRGAGIPGTHEDLEKILLPGPDDLVDAVAARLPLTDPPSQAAAFTALEAAHTARRDGPALPDPRTAALLLHALTDVWVRDACLVWADDAAWWLWTNLIRAAPDGWIAPTATLIAVSAYRRGDGTTAAIAAEHALLDRPGYHLAELVLDALSMAVTPTQLNDIITAAMADLPDELQPTPAPDPTP